MLTPKYVIEYERGILATLAKVKEASAAEIYSGVKEHLFSLHLTLPVSFSEMFRLVRVYEQRAIIHSPKLGYFHLTDLGKELAKDVVAGGVS
jgi:hypothetical protein